VNARTLVLRREALQELTTADLNAVVAGATVGTACATAITVLVHGCASDPRYCHYATDFC
jgi:hypothetical protein